LLSLALETPQKSGEHAKRGDDGPNENHMSIAFSVERNSGMHGGDLADPTSPSLLHGQGRPMRKM
jgi:hypothetical protein